MLAAALRPRLKKEKFPALRLRAASQGSVGAPRSRAWAARAAGESGGMEEVAKNKNPVN